MNDGAGGVGVSNATGIGGIAVGVGLRTVKVALQASTDNNATLLETIKDHFRTFFTIEMKLLYFQ
jgi:hypothetical protein